MITDDLEARIKELEEENEKLKEEKEFFYKSAKQFREQIEKWEKDFAEGRIVATNNTDKTKSDFIYRM